MPTWVSRGHAESLWGARARARVLMVSLCRVAMFIPLYCEYKEQKVQRVARQISTGRMLISPSCVRVQEYVSWLGNVRKFIDV